MTDQSIEIFCCYAHEDKKLLQDFKKQLISQQRWGRPITIWSDSDINAGAEWEEEINKHLNTAHIILLFISPDFIASDYCISKEMLRAMERYERGEAYVIPIILRPIYWENAPFGKLQALPTNAKPVTSWYNQQEEAFYEIAQGITKVIDEFEKWKSQQKSRWIRKQQPRMISLFGYETEGGTQSELWTDPLNPVLDNEKFEKWYATKSVFREEELINHYWIKSRGSESTYLVQFISNGNFKESIIFDPDNQWQGRWQITPEGTLRTKVGEYELDIFANQNSSIHTGIEYKKGLNDPFAHFVLFLYNGTFLKHWSLNEVPILVERIFDQTLNRPPNQKELIVYGSVLSRGEMTIRSIIKILGLTQEYKEVFIFGKTVDEALEYCYKHFLGREIDPVGRTYYTERVEHRGFSWLINDLIDSDEYKRDIGEDSVPKKVN